MRMVTFEIGRDVGVGAIDCVEAGVGEADEGEAEQMSGTARMPSHSLTTGVESSSMSCCWRVTRPR